MGGVLIRVWQLLFALRSVGVNRAGRGLSIAQWEQYLARLRRHARRLGATARRSSTRCSSVTGCTSGAALGIGLMAAGVYTLARSGNHDMPTGILAALAGLVLWTGRVPAMVVVLAAGAVGWLLALSATGRRREAPRQRSHR